jgi:acetyltransferase-like isoleucine patch superfamily enzyme
MLRRSDIRRLPWQLRYDLGERASTALRRAIIAATHLHCTVRFQGPVRIGPGFTLFIPARGTLIVGPDVDFRGGFRCEIWGDGRVEIGAGTIFTSNTLIRCSTSVVIGDYCAFGQSVVIQDGYHRYSDPGRHWLNQGYDFRPIHIGDGAGVSDKCTIQADIGERAMIGSCSVVHRAIPAYCVAVGSPARVVRYFGPPERRQELVRPPAQRLTTDRFLSDQTQTGIT